MGRGLCARAEPVGCLDLMSWLETYRGTVYRWEVDNVDHFTVAYYFERFEDATLGILQAIGLDPGSLAGAGRACVTLDCHVRYLRELRVGDILHIRSGARVPLTHAQQQAGEPLLVEWTPPPEAWPAYPDAVGDDGFVDSARDTVKAREVDALGQAAWPAYIHRFSAANGHTLAGFGMTPAYMQAERRGFSTFEFRLHFAGALRAGDPVRVRSALLHVGKSSIRLLHRMANARTGEEVAILEQSGVHLDMVARRPTPLPDSLRERAKPLLLVAAPAGGRRP